MLDSNGRLLVVESPCVAELLGGVCPESKVVPLVVPDGISFVAWLDEATGG